MMTTGAPRSLRGLDDGTLEAARRAAQRSGLSMSEWLDTVIARQAMVEGCPPRHTQCDDFDDDALAAAIASLTRRIRAMDEHSCFVLTDLHERLEEIARRAGAVAGAKRRGAESSLTGVGTIIENLSRDIDNVDETARTTIEGMRDLTGEATQAGDADRYAEATRRLGEQRSPDCQPTRSKRDSATSAGFDAIRIHLEALLAASMQGPPAAGFDPTFRSTQSHIEEARSCLADKLTDEEVSTAVAGIVTPQQSIDDQIDLGVLARGQRQIEETLDALHDELAALSERLAAPPAPPAASGSMIVDALGRLESRLDAVLGRVDTVLEQATSGDGISGIGAEIGKIRQEIAERDLSFAAQIESQLAGLTRRLDAAREPDRLRPALKELEEQVARLVSKLERGTAQNPSLKDIEARLLRLENPLLASRREWAEAASNAASDAVKEVSEGVSGADLGRALARDLENIRRASSAADSRMPAASRQTQGTHDLLKATGTDGAGVAIRQVEPGPAFNTGSLGADVVKLNHSALRELAKSSVYDQRDDTNDRKADFIAAARRAAQATAATATQEVQKVAAEAKPGAFARIGRAIRGRRRAMFAATAALVLAASAAHMFGGGGAATMDGRSAGSIGSMTTSGGGDRGGLAAADEIVPPSTTAPEIRKATPAVTKPPHHDPRAFAFAAPEPLTTRFGDTPLEPPAGAFVRTPDYRGLLPLAVAIGSAELREAAAAGDPNAAVKVAARYAEGRLVPRDLTKAAQWYELAAERGVAVAQYRLASLYERGQGVAKDPSVAADWYRRAATQGNTGAMHNLAVMLSAGVDGAPSYTEAVKWFRAAADRGVEDSQYNLGVIYARGLGQDRNLVESYKWFALAAASGDREAGTHRDEIGRALSVDDRAKARAAVAAWRPVPTRAQANMVAALPPAWKVPTDGISVADRRALVMKIQTALADQGYDPGPADGFAGPRTRQAVLAFQRNIGLAETGTISSDVVAALAGPSG